MAKTLIIGGSGFVSGAMARLAVARGDETFAVTRGKRPMAAGVVPVVADRNDAAGFAAAVGEAGFCECVVDCIGFSAAHAEQDIEVFFPLGGPARAGHLVFLSSDFVCSPIDRPLTLDETFERFDTAPYGAGKRAAEVVLLEAARKRGLPITILRPCHIYGPWSLLGCLPLHGRDPELVARLRRGETLRLLGGGFFLQQPMYVEDLAGAALACARLPKTRGNLYHIAGPETVESRGFYRMIGELLGVGVTIAEEPFEPYLREHPEHRAFCCHRVYSQAKAVGDGVPVPGTGLREGLGRHLGALGRCEAVWPRLGRRGPRGASK